MTSTLPFHVWIIGPDSTYLTRLCHRLSLNPDYLIRRFLTVPQAQAYRVPVGAVPHALLFDADGHPAALPRRLVHKLLQRLPEAHYYILTDCPDPDAEEQLLRQGVSGYFAKDLASVERVWTALAQARAVPSPATTAAFLAPAGQLLGLHASMQRTRELIAKAARTTITVSVRGETGTGKELVAQAIHAQSARGSAPFVALNMAAIPRELLESELFGHEKGAFTGAASRRVGRFEEAHGGTLFLDEIADLELPLQAKLLRVLQERAVTPVGGSRAVAFDVRLVVATHHDLAAEVQAGRFRPDLYYRLLGLPLELPPLRERGSDILLLAESFVRQFSQANSLPPRPFSAAAQQQLLAYPYPGNVRELKAVVELAAVLAEGRDIDTPHLKFPESPRPVAVGLASAIGSAFPSLREQTLAIMQHSLIDLRGDVVAAANRLCVGRSTLYRLIQSGQLRLPNVRL